MAAACRWRTRSGMQAPQVRPQPLRRTACSRARPSLRMRRTASSNAMPAHSQRVMGRPGADGRPAVRGSGREVVQAMADDRIIVKLNFNFKGQGGPLPRCLEGGAGWRDNPYMPEALDVTC